MERGYDYRSDSDWDRYRGSPRRDRDTYERYDRRSPPEKVVYVYDGTGNERSSPSNGGQDWSRRSPGERSPDRRNIVERSPDRRNVVERSPDHQEKSSGRYRKSPSDYRRSPDRYSPDRRRSLSPVERRKDDYRDSPRDRHDRRRSRSPLPPGEDNYVRESTVIEISRIPFDVSETEVLKRSITRAVNNRLLFENLAKYLNLFDLVFYVLVVKVINISFRNHGKSSRIIFYIICQFFNNKMIIQIRYELQVFGAPVISVEMETPPGDAFFYNVGIHDNISG